MYRSRACMLISALILASGLAGSVRAAADGELAAAVASPSRDPAFVARDAIRHPSDELAFFGLRPDANVVEIWPGGGYWTEILAPYLAAHGALTVALPLEANSDAQSRRFKASFATRQGFNTVRVTTLDKDQTRLAAPASADLVLTFRNVHNWMHDGDADRVFAAFFDVLKPGGVLGVEEHRGLVAKPQDPKAENGYVRQDYVVALAKKAGFELVGTSEIDANPRDTKDYEKGVWTLPPSFAMKDVDRAKYAAIGEADNMVLKFRKPLR